MKDAVPHEFRRSPSSLRRQPLAATVFRCALICAGVVLCAALTLTDNAVQRLFGELVTTDLRRFSGAAARLQPAVTTTRWEPASLEVVRSIQVGDQVAANAATGELMVDDGGVQRVTLPACEALVAVGRRLWCRTNATQAGAFSALLASRDASAPLLVMPLGAGLLSGRRFDGSASDILCVALANRTLLMLRCLDHAPACVPLYLSPSLVEAPTYCDVVRVISSSTVSAASVGIAVVARSSVEQVLITHRSLAGAGSPASFGFTWLPPPTEANVFAVSAPATTDGNNAIVIGYWPRDGRLGRIELQSLPIVASRLPLSTSTAPPASSWASNSPCGVEDALAMTTPTDTRTSVVVIGAGAALRCGFGADIAATPIVLPLQMARDESVAFALSDAAPSTAGAVVVAGICKRSSTANFANVLRACRAATITCSAPLSPGSAVSTWCQEYRLVDLGNLILPLTTSAFTVPRNDESSAVLRYVNVGGGSRAAVNFSPTPRVTAGVAVAVDLNSNRVQIESSHLLA